MTESGQPYGEKKERRRRQGFSAWVGPGGSAESRLQVNEESDGVWARSFLRASTG